MISGLHLPHLSAHDPPVAGEGTLFPLGLFAIADGLANDLAPWLTARMSRVRFVAAIAAAAHALESLGDRVAADGVTPPYLVFEWLLVEALAGQRGLPASATLHVPGIEKARAARARGRHLDAMSYLKTPKVFGFHGVYKRLAVGMRVVSPELALLERGDRLLRAWEREQGFPGFADGARNSRGRSLLDAIEREVSAGLGQKGVTTARGSHLWGHMASAFRPDGAGPEERALLTQWLRDASEPLQREFVQGVHRLDSTLPEHAAVEAIAPNASPELGQMLAAIRDFEHLARVLHTGLDVLRRASTAAGTKPLRPGEMTGEPLLGTISRSIRSTYDRAAESLDRVGKGPQFEAEFGSFREADDPERLTLELLRRHQEVQAAKPPHGKRSWFEDFGEAFVVRLPYRLEDPPALRDDFVHPYRVGALQSFQGDLQ